MIKLVNGNCLEVMRSMDDNSADIAITSPPYNMNLRIRNGKYCSRQVIKEMSTKYEGFSDNLPIDQFYEYHSNVLHEMLRVAPLVFYNIQIVTGSKRAFFKIIGEFNEQLKDIIVWDKTREQPAMQSGVINRRTALLLVFDRDNAISRSFSEHNFERGTLSDLWSIPPKKPKDLRNHGAVFPEELVQCILDNFGYEGMVVLDPFMGTGTTGVVARRNGLDFIGVELLPHYFELAQQRMGVVADD